MVNRLLLVGVLALVALFYLQSYGLLRAAPIPISVSTSAPANGTATNMNLTFDSQQWIGFYGNLTMQVRQTGAALNYSLLNVTVKNGTVYLTKAGENPSFASSIVANVSDTNTDSNFSLSGEYTTASMGFSNSTGMIICGVGTASNGIWYLNTSDNIPIGILKDGPGSSNYYMCSKVYPQTANSNLHLAYQYAIIGPKTPSWGNGGYDLYYEGLVS
jgi:hypothetical protein